MKRGLMLLSVLSLVFAGTAGAAVQQGDTELEFLAGYISENGENNASDIEVLFASGAVGYFLNDNLQVSGAAFAALFDNGVDVDVYGLGARARWHFMPTNQVVPYIGGQIFWATTETDFDDIDGTLWGPIGGARIELNAYNDLFVEGQWHWWDGDISDVLDDGFAIFVGIVHQFK